MSKKHFIEIAKILKTSASKEEIIIRLTIYLALSNPLFDEDKFLKACK